jgi:CheY-like chemotaxis protein
MVANQKVIVLVEDSQNDEILTIRALRKAGIINEIVVARDGEQAIEVICGSNLKPGQKIQLVILDLKLPKISGIDVLKKNSQHRKSQRFTGSNSKFFP